VNEERAKAAKALRVGEQVVIRKPPFEHAVVVKGIVGATRLGDRSRRRSSRRPRKAARAAQASPRK
jgi:hypothetical protein